MECPYRLHIEPGDISRKRTIIFFDEVLDSVAGLPTSFEIQARDAYNNHILSGNHAFQGVIIRTHDRAVVPLTFTDNHNGIYQGDCVDDSINSIVGCLFDDKQFIYSCVTGLNSRLFDRDIYRSVFWLVPSSCES